MYTLFDIANICAGLILGVSVWANISNIGESLEGFAKILGPFRSIIGTICATIGVFLLILHPGCGTHDIVGILAGLTLVGEELTRVPSIGDNLVKFSKILVPFETVIGIAALSVGILGLLNIHFLC